jgi:hypothetical protein
VTADVATRHLDELAIGWAAVDPAGGLGFVPARRLLVDAPVVTLTLGLGDRVLVSAGESVPAGAALADRLRDPQPVDGPLADGDDRFAPGAWWTADAAPAHRSGAGRAPATASAGELLYAHAGHWRLAGGAHRDPLEAPSAGIVREVRPGIGLTFASAAVGIPGVAVVGGPARGRLLLATGADGELRAAGLDVGRTGMILVGGSRTDAETLIRARAMGVRGVVVASLSGKDLRDFAASERRQRASLHQLPPFAVLVLEGHVRRPIAGPIMAIFAALEGRDVAIAGDPPMLVADGDLGATMPRPPADWVRARYGSLAGREGRWMGPAGLRRFAAGAHLEAGLVRFDDGPPVALPLADLERFA